MSEVKAGCDPNRSLYPKPISLLLKFNVHIFFFFFLHLFSSSLMQPIWCNLYEDINADTQIFSRQIKCDRPFADTDVSVSLDGGGEGRQLGVARREKG